MSARWRHAAAALPFVALAAPAAERIPLPASPPPEPAAAPAPESVVVLPGWIRAFGVESWRDVVRFSPWSASLAMTFDDQEQQLSTPGTPSQRFSTRLAAENFTVSNDAISVLDPRVFTASLSLGMLLQQEKQKGPDKSSSENGHLVNYAFDGVFFGESPYNANITSVRNQSTYVAPSGSTTDAVYQSSYIAFHLRENSFLRDREWLPYFTGNFRVGQQDEKQETRSEGQVYRQDDRRDVVTLDFQNGGETSDLNFQYQYNKLDNRVYSAGSYDSHSANLAYSLDFGPTLNRRWDSRINYYSRKGNTEASDFKNLDISEYLVVDHNVARSTNYSYQLNRQDTPFGVATAHSASAQINQQVYANFAVDGSLIGQYSSLPGGTISTAGASGNATYQRALPKEGHLALTVGGGHLVTTTQVPTGLVQVVDSPYAVPEAVGAGSAILLKDRNVIAPSIVVVVLKGGARVTATLDVDYSIRVDGDRTSVVPLPASAVMQPGDPLNISYNYEVAGDSKYATDSRSGSVSLDWKWIGASFSHDETNQEPLDGTDASLLFDQKRQNGSVWLRGNWDAFQARASANVVRYDSTRLAYVERRLDQYASWFATPGLQLNLTADEYRTEYEQPVHTTTGGGVRFDAQWRQWEWLTTGYLSRRIYRDTLQPHETIDEAGLRLRRSWSKLELLINFGAQDRQRGESRARNGFFHIGAVRRF